MDLSTFTALLEEAENAKDTRVDTMLYCTKGVAGNLDVWHVKMFCLLLQICAQRFFISAVLAPFSDFGFKSGRPQWNDIFQTLAGGAKVTLLLVTVCALIHTFIPRACTHVHTTIMQTSMSRRVRSQNDAKDIELAPLSAEMSATTEVRKDAFSFSFE